MGHSKLEILFITEASRSGAPILLGEVLKELSSRPDLNISILIKRYDALVPEFSQYGKTYVLKGKLYQDKNPSLPKKIWRALGTRWRKLVIYPRLKGARIIISNTVTNGGILKELSFLKAKNVCYVHELENRITTWKPQSDITNTFRYTQLYLAPSTAVKENLLVNHGISESQIKLFNTYLSIHADADAIQKQVAKRKFCEQHQLDPSCMLVLGMGTANEGKGIDLFIESAQLCRAHNIRFTWIGGFENETVKAAVDKKIEEYDLAGKIIFTGHLPRSYKNLLPFDLFFLSSREDSYPLVVLEAALLGIPSACFAGSGGGVDFVQGNGWIINDFSAEDAAEQIIYLNQHRNELAEAGSKAREKFLQLHNNRRLLMQQFDEIIKTVLN